MSRSGSVQWLYFNVPGKINRVNTIEEINFLLRLLAENFQIDLTVTVSRKKYKRHEQWL